MKIRPFETFEPPDNFKGEILSRGPGQPAYAMPDRVALAARYGENEQDRQEPTEADQPGRFRQAVGLVLRALHLRP